MKSFIVFALFVAVASAATLPQLAADAAAEVKSFFVDNLGLDTGYKFGYETSNGISAQEEGSFKPGPETPILTVRGQYNYYDSNGAPHFVAYTADENGFAPVSDDIPKSA